MVRRIGWGREFVDLQILANSAGLRARTPRSHGNVLRILQQPRPARCDTLHWLVGGAALLRTFLQRGLRQRGADCIAEFCNSRRICCRILHSRRAWHARSTPSRSTILKWRLDPQSIIELINKIVYVVVLGVHFSLYFHILLECSLKLACVALLVIYK